ncbi:hypothetical protein [Caulobacter sp. 17J65-9]|uniref:hypothetical protein n=1 Tax=Caulobacter sp. 17J65-9 TaxID=2709382 RepID=UPI0013CDB8CF|nr:hypothetical protein [Caulobacter sp. 17J65-9]NEX92738.1 hypothetical protein [Caulobacter sp. 17J65-9]
MAVSMLPLKGGGLSLEFELADVERVSSSLRDHFGTPQVEHHPFHLVYKFKQADLLFQNEWDDPCLIASTPEGVAMLEKLAADLV